MISQLTKTERLLALVISVFVAFVGLLMAGGGQADPLGAHGFVVLGFGIAMAFVIISGYHAPEPAKERLAQYYDDPVKAGIVLAMGWAVFAMFIGDWMAWLLAYPEMTFDAARAKPFPNRVPLLSSMGSGLRRPGRTRVEQNHSVPHAFPSRCPHELPSGHGRRVGVAGVGSAAQADYRLVLP